MKLHVRFNVSYAMHRLDHKAFIKSLGKAISCSSSLIGA